MPPKTRSINVRGKPFKWCGSERGTSSEPEAGDVSSGSCGVDAAAAGVIGSSCTTGTSVAATAGATVTSEAAGVASAVRIAAGATGDGVKARVASVAAGVATCG